MINTVTGKIKASELGLTLIHEHILNDSNTADLIDTSKYDVLDIKSKIVPLLYKLRRVGCTTIVDSTPEGSGRSVKVLYECAKESGINIITNTGTFYGNGVSSFIKKSNINDIVNYWVNESKYGIDETDILPGFIKIALDDGNISSLQEKILRAACRTSLKTGLTIQCHALHSKTILEAVAILKDEGLSFDKFIWAHADHEFNISVMIELGLLGMWIEIDSIGSIPYKKHVGLIKDLIISGLSNRILISQDTGWYNIGEPEGGVIKPYHKIFTEFIPLCILNGIDDIYKILKDNPMNCLDIN